MSRVVGLVVAAFLMTVVAVPARADDGVASAPVAAVDCSPTDEATLRLADCSGVEPVADADPADTAGVIAAAAVASTAAAELPHFCRYASEVTLYAERDWIRLVKYLAADSSQCADFYVSVPPFSTHKLDPRPGEADAIRAFGPHFRPMAEIHYVTWSAWVKQDPTRTFYGAGVKAGSTIVSSPFNYETWAVNEAPSSVRQDAGAARADFAEFVRGLHDGSGVPGLVWVVGVGQRTSPLDVYYANLRNWLLDSPFWSQISGSVRFWAQEVYGDIRAWAVPGASREARTAHLADYLMHPLNLAEALGDPAAQARELLERTYVPFTNGAAWIWSSGFGWTAVDALLMQSYVSEQIYAVRHYAGAHPQVGPDGRWGAAYSPRPLPIDLTGTGLLLTRMASALHEAYELGGASQTGACGPPGEHDWCQGELAGAAFVDGWSAFGFPPKIVP